MGNIKNHKNLIISKTLNNDTSDNTSDNTIIINSIENALYYIKENYNNFGNIFICGGSSIYNNFYNVCINNHEKYKTIIYATIVHKDFECDNLISNALFDIIMTQYHNIHNTHHTMTNIDYIIQKNVDII